MRGRHDRAFNPRWLHLHAAVDSPDLAGDVGGGVLAEEVDDARDLLGLAQAPERDLPLDHVEHLLGHGRHHLGVDVAGATVLTVSPAPPSSSLSAFFSACAASRASVIVSPNMPAFDDA